MKQEILPVNLLRFLAALGILFVHKFSYLIDAGFIPKSLNFLSPFTQYGYLGVNLFFLISGFVITLSSEGRTLGHFVSARFIRLFPVFWICVSITTLFTFILAKNETISLSQFLANLTMMPQYYGNHDFIDGSYWTLLLELKFYFAIAFLLFLQRLIPISLQKISIVLSLPLLYDVFFFNPYSHALSNDILLVVFHNYLGEYGQYFIAGILFYGIYRNSATIYSYTALTICYLVAILKALDSSYESNNSTLIIVHITAFFGIFLVISLKKITNDLFSFLGSYANKILVTLGAATYPLYLLHSKIINMLSTSLIENNLVAWYAVFFVLFELVALVYVVNSFDVYVRSHWKKSFIIQNLLGRIKSPLIKRLFNI